MQAGAGIPSWQWNTYRLSWSGPVDSEQTMRLLVLPRWLVSLLRFIEVLLLLLFVAVFAAEILKRELRLPGGLRIGKAGAGLAAIGHAGTGADRSAAAAGTGGTARCRATTGARGAAHAGARMRAALRRARGRRHRDRRARRANEALDSRARRRRDAIARLGRRLATERHPARWHAAGQVSRGPGQALWVRLLAGRHTLVLSGPIAAVDSLEIPFPAPPRVVTASGDGWFVAGIKDRRLLSGSLQLTRLQAAKSRREFGRWESSRFPAFVEVSRTLQLDLDWRVTTTVSRVAPAQGALTLELPLAARRVGDQR